VFSFGLGDDTWSLRYALVMGDHLSGQPQSQDAFKILVELILASRESTKPAS
jgi:hypothetical protein